MGGRFLFLWRRAEEFLSTPHDLHELRAVGRRLRIERAAGCGLKKKKKEKKKGKGTAEGGKREGGRKEGEELGGAQWGPPSSKDSTPESQVLAASFSCRLLMISCSSEPALFSSAAFCTVT